MQYCKKNYHQTIRTGAERRFAALIIICLAGNNLLPANQAGSSPNTLTKPVLSINVIEGEGAVNNIRQRTARETIVEIEDENHRPVAGVTVTIRLSQKGSLNFFVKRQLIATTNASGQVRANPLALKDTVGRMDLRVRASLRGQTVAKTIHQTNVSVPTTGTGVVAPAAGAAVAGATGSAGVVAATAVTAVAVPVSLTVPIIAAVVIGGAAAAVGGVAVAKSGGGKTAQVSVGTPRFP